MAEAFGITCHELMSLDFRCGSMPLINSAILLPYLSAFVRCRLSVPAPQLCAGRVLRPLVSIFWSFGMAITLVGALAVVWR